MTHSFNTSLLAALLLLSGFATQARAQTLIDNFNDTPATLSITESEFGSKSRTDPITNDLGVDRDVFIEKLGSGNGDMFLELAASPNNIIFISDRTTTTGVFTSDFDLTYDNFATPVDLTAGANGFIIEGFDYSIIVNGNFQVDVYLMDQGGNFGTRSLFSLFAGSGGELGNPSPETLQVFFSDMSWGSVDLTQITEIQLQTRIQFIDDNISPATLAFDSFSTGLVPEPASLALLGLGSLLIAGRSRRQA